MKDLAARAKSKKLGPDEFQGGTLTVSNLGGLLLSLALVSTGLIIATLSRGAWLALAVVVGVLIVAAICQRFLLVAPASLPVVLKTSGRGRAFWPVSGLNNEAAGPDLFQDPVGVVTRD